MKIISLAIPDSTYDRAQQSASSYQTDISALCSSILTDHFDDELPAETTPTVAHRAPSGPSLNGFNMHTLFQGFPDRSILFAERFLAEVQRVEPNAQITKRGSAIDIRPNFVWIEAVLSRKQGIRVSFYGSPDRYPNAPFLVRGMGSFSRVVVATEGQLNEVLPLVKQAHDMKFNKRRH
jgi:hypothetical protein